MLGGRSIAHPTSWSLRTPGRPNTLTGSPTHGFFFKRSRLINAGWKHEYPRNRASVHRAREVFHAYRHPRLSRQGNADEGEAQGLAGRRRRRHVNETAFWSEVTDCIDNDV